MTSCPRCLRVFDDGVRFCPVDGALVTTTHVEDRNLGQVLLGQFEVRDVCGRGAMGTVYRAYQRNMDRIVAVKILRRELLKEPEVVRRFLREARAAAKLQHPNIVTVHLVGETDDGVPFLVMEHIDGVALEAICEAQGAQPTPRILSLGRQIAGALSEAHDAGIVHRDLKPANILITDRSRVPDLVKVLDFGIAKIVSGADQSVLTRDGMIFGTPHYIAPEQATGAEVDARADIYSLGVILFRLATGRLPFEGTQGMQVVLKHLREQPPKPRTLEPTLLPALEDLILACLSKEPGARPKDAETVMAALEQIESNPAADASATQTLHGMTPAMLRPQTVATPDARTIRPDDATGPTALAVAKTVAAAQASGAAPAVKKPAPTNGAARKPARPPDAMATGRVRAFTDEEPPPRSSRGLYWGAAAIALGTAVGVGGALWSNRATPRAAVSLPPPAARLGDPAPAPKPVPPPAPQPVLVDEHVLTEGALSLKAGFPRAPQVGVEVPLDVLIERAGAPLQGAAVEVAVTPPSGPVEKLAQAIAGEPGRYTNAYTFHRAGRHKVRVAATPTGGHAPLVLSFDVDPKGELSARPSRKPGRAREDERPAVEVLPPAESPRVAGAAQPKPAVAPAPAPTAPVVVKPVDPPPQAEPPPRRERPVRALPPPAEEQPDDRPPPPPQDPTTLPPPSPDDPK